MRSSGAVRPTARVVAVAVVIGLAGPARASAGWLPAVPASADGPAVVTRTGWVAAFATINRAANTLVVKLRPPGGAFANVSVPLTSGWDAPKLALTPAGDVVVAVQRPSQGFEVWRKAHDSAAFTPGQTVSASGAASPSLAVTGDDQLVLTYTDGGAPKAVMGPRTGALSAPVTLVGAAEGTASAPRLAVNATGAAAVAVAVGSPADIKVVVYRRTTGGALQRVGGAGATVAGWHTCADDGQGNTGGAGGANLVDLALGDDGAAEVLWQGAESCTTSGVTVTTKSVRGGRLAPGGTVLTGTAELASLTSGSVFGTNTFADLTGGTIVPRQGGAATAVLSTFTTFVDQQLNVTTNRATDSYDRADAAGTWGKTGVGTNDPVVAAFPGNAPGGMQLVAGAIGGPDWSPYAAGHSVGAWTPFARQLDGSYIRAAALTASGVGMLTSDGPDAALVTAGDGLHLFDGTPPTIDAVTLPSTMIAGVNATYAVTASERLSSVADVKWDFDDGSTAHGASVTHALSEGSHEVRVTVQDTTGNSATQTRQVVAEPPAHVVTQTVTNTVTTPPVTETQTETTPAPPAPPASPTETVTVTSAPPIPADTTVPKLLALTLKKHRVTRRLTANQLIFGLSEPVTLTVAVRRTGPGRARGLRCVALLRPRRGVRCAPAQTAVPATLGLADEQHLALSLGPKPPAGRYIVTLTATDRAGNVGRAVTVTFTVAR